MTVDQPKYKTTDEVDFVVIGSGAAGGVLTLEQLQPRMALRERPSSLFSPELHAA